MKSESWAGFNHKAKKVDLSRQKTAILYLLSFTLRTLQMHSNAQKMMTLSFFPFRSQEKEQ